MFCANCGREIKASKYCPFCGAESEFLNTENNSFQKKDAHNNEESSLSENDSFGEKEKIVPVTKPGEMVSSGKEDSIIENKENEAVQTSGKEQKSNNGTSLKADDACKNTDSLEIKSSSVQQKKAGISKTVIMIVLCAVAVIGVLLYFGKNLSGSSSGTLLLIEKDYNTGEREYFEYDDFGNLIKSTYIQYWGENDHGEYEEKLVTEYKYEKGNCLEKIDTKIITDTSNNDQEIWDWEQLVMTYSYDSDGNPISSEGAFKHSEDDDDPSISYYSYQYDENGNLTVESWYSQYDYDFAQTYTNGYLIPQEKHYMYDSNNNRIKEEFFDSGELRWYRDYIYNEKNEMIKESEYQYDNTEALSPKLVHEYTYDYDEYGNVIHKLLYNYNDSTSTSEWNFSYRYDDLGNILSCEISPGPLGYTAKYKAFKLLDKKESNNNPIFDSWKMRVRTIYEIPGGH